MAALLIPDQKLAMRDVTVSMYPGNRFGVRDDPAVRQVVIAQHTLAKFSRGLTPTAADPREKLLSESVGGCSGNGSEITSGALFGSSLDQRSRICRVCKLVPFTNQWRNFATYANDDLAGSGQTSSQVEFGRPRTKVPVS